MDKLIDYSAALVDVDKSETSEDIRNAFVKANLKIEFDNDEGLYCFYSENDVTGLYMLAVAYLKAAIRNQLENIGE